MDIKRALRNTTAGLMATVMTGCLAYTPVKTNDISVRDFSCCNTGAKVYTDGLGATVIDEAGGLDIEKGQTWREIAPAEMQGYSTDGTIAKQLTSIDPKTGATRLEATILQNENSLELYFEKTGKKYTVQSPMSEQKLKGGGDSGGGAGGTG